MSEEMIRSFLAVEVGDEEVRWRIRNLQKTLLDTNTNLKLVEVENVHITLRFFGEIPTSTVERICGALQKIRFSPFQVSLRGVGVFPSLRRINVVWVGMEKGVVGLTDLFSQIESRLKKLGFPPEYRGLSPHVTIARVRSGRKRDRLAKVVSLMRDMEVGSFTVDSVKLKRSVLTPKGPVYSTLCEVRG